MDLYGDKISNIRGTGMEFDEVRTYTYGDDVRNIDWNVTARQNLCYVKTYKEERETPVLILIDVSFSLNFSTTHESKKIILAEIVAFLALSNIVKENNKVGFILFAEDIISFFPQTKDLSTLEKVIYQILAIEHKEYKTNFLNLVHFINKIKSKIYGLKFCRIFLISDMYSNIHSLNSKNNSDYSNIFSLETAIKKLSKKNFLIGLNIIDPIESQGFNASYGLVEWKDTETGEMICIDISNHFKKKYKDNINSFLNNTKKAFLDSNALYFSLKTDQDYLKKMISFL